jgi:hypothetical protein
MLDFQGAFIPQKGAKILKKDEQTMLEYFTAPKTSANLFPNPTSTVVWHAVTCFQKVRFAVVQLEIGEARGFFKFAT